MNFPDFPALQRLAKSLWRDGETRGAALLVGAGLSKFARLPGQGTRSPPLWNELRDAMMREVYPDDDRPKEPPDPLRLAEEYRALLGQAALDDFIRESVPEHSWNPGDLHEQLLRLPWADVLTTNWDTLLERVSPVATDTVYEPVRVVTDIARAKQPRIIKLHGSLPSGPFIFAEEDYRTYPEKHAPFVNLARQVFLENELCLLGFSGNDPNFLQWSGWVRDHLGGSARRIYLVGVLRLPTASRRLLESRNVVPIDLYPLVESLPRDEQHAKGLEQFLQFLDESEPKPVHSWTTASSAISGADMDRIWKDPDAAAKKLKDVIVSWKHDRSQYPGWLICSREKRSDLRHGLDSALFRAQVLAKLSSEELIEALFECGWRCERALEPLPMAVLDAMKLVVADKSKSENDRIRIGAILLKSLRDIGEIAEFDQAVEELLPIDSLSVDQRAEIAYQRCLRLRSGLQYEKVREYSAEIKGTDPIWRLRRASVLLDIGERDDAEALLREAVVDLKDRRQRDRRSIWILSRLGWAEYLIHAIELTNRSKETRKRKQADWPFDYQRAKCDPWDDLDSMRSNLDADLDTRAKDHFDITPQFDAGVYKEGGRRIRVGGFTSAYAWFRLSEEIGLPARAGWTSVRAPLDEKALTLLFEPTESWYCRFIDTIHGKDDEFLERYFSRVAVAAFSNELFASLKARVVSAVTYWQTRRRGDDLRKPGDASIVAIDKLQFLLEIWSRLIVRFDVSEARECWFAAIDHFREKEYKHPWFFEPLSNILKRSAEALPPPERSALALSAIDFPLEGEAGFGGPERYWPRPIDYLTRCTLARPGERSFESRVQQLIAAVGKTEAANDRADAVAILTRLHDDGILTQAEQKDFGEQLYSQTDPSTGMPTNTQMHGFVFLDLPAPDPAIPVKFATDVIYPNWSPLSANKLINFKLAARKLKERGVLPSRDTALALLDAGLSWRYPPQKDHDLLGHERLEAKHIAQEIGPTLYYGVAPLLTSADITKERSDALEAAIFGMPSPWMAQLFPVFASLRADVEPQAINVLHRLLSSWKFEDVQGGAGSLPKWSGTIPNVLIKALLVAIRSLDNPNLLNLIWCARQLRSAGKITNEDKSDLATALGEIYSRSNYADIDPAGRLRVSISMVRTECVRLARELADEGFNKAGLNSWLDNYADDPLPEVRFALSDVIETGSE